MLKVRAAYWEEDAEIGKIARSSPYTSGFHGTIRGEALRQAYENNLIGVSACLSGFVYCYHLKARPCTTLHYLGVRPEARGRGLGKALVAWVLETSPHDVIQLKAEAANAIACRFYERLGFKASKVSFTKKGVAMNLYKSSRSELSERLLLTM